MSQTSYSLNHAPYKLGQKVDAMFDLVEGTWVAQEILPTGRIAAKTIGIDNGAQLPDGTNQEFIGGILDCAQIIADDAGLVAYQINDAVNILRTGKIVVWSEVAIDPDTDSVFVRVTAGGAGELRGYVRNDVSGGDAVAFPKAKFRNTTAAAGLVVLEIDAQP